MKSALGQKIHADACMFVNGEPVEVREFHQKILQKRSVVLGYYKRKFNADEHEQFWSTRFSGELPSESLKQHVLNEILYIKIQQMLAKEKGILQDTRYTYFLRKWREENDRRRHAVANGEIIYGPVQYEEAGYYDYTFTNMVVKLKSLMAENEFKCEIDELRAYYETVKERFYRKEDTIYFQKLIFQAETVEANLLNHEQLSKAAMKLKEKLVGGVSLMDAMDDIQQSDQVKIKLESQIFDAASARMDSKYQGAWINEVKKLSSGQVSSVLKVYGEVCLIQCVYTKHGGYKSFEEVENNVKLKYVDHEYEQYIMSLLKLAKVEIYADVQEMIKLAR